MELRDYLRVLAKHWIGIILITVLAVSGVAVYTFLQPRVYTATAQTFVAIASPAGGGGQSLAPDATYTLQRISSYLQIISSPDVLQPVIDELGLDRSVSSLAGAVSASNPVDTVIVNVSASDTDPAVAAELANAVAQQLTVVIQQLETTAAGDLVPVKATLTNPASPPTSPSSPRTRVNLLLGGLIGLALGIGWAFLRESLDTTVKSPEELQDIVGAGPIGTIGYDPDAETKPLVALDQRSSRAEAFRTIRTNLHYVDVDNPPKIITITSSVPREGKTTTAVNLAITFAQAGQKVILVESDLRRPKVSNYLGIETSIGLTDALAGQISLDQAILSWNRGMLDVLPAGQSPPNPSELLASHQMRDALARLRERYDIVLVDATPLLPVTDGAIVSALSDGAILVSRFSSTSREQLAIATDALAQVDARILGTVMNFVPVGRRGYGYKYGYKYGYRGYRYGGYSYGGYGGYGGYGNDDRRKTQAEAPAS